MKIGEQIYLIVRIAWNVGLGCRDNVNVHMFIIHTNFWNWYFQCLDSFFLTQNGER